MFSRLGLVNAFRPNDIFNLRCIYQDVTLLYVEEDLYLILINLNTTSGWGLLYWAVLCEQRPLGRKGEEQGPFRGMGGRHEGDRLEDGQPEARRSRGAQRQVAWGGLMRV